MMTRERQILFSSDQVQVFKVKEDDRTFVRKIIHCQDPVSVAASLESLIIEHPNICKVYEVRVQPRSFEIDMEYIDGVPLTDYLKSASIAERIRILRQLVQLVKMLYNIQHPYSFVQSNLWVCDGKLKLIGFGIHSHCFANESEVLRMIVAPFLPSNMIAWWFDRITSRQGSSKIRYLRSFAQFLMGYHLYRKTRYGLALLLIFGVSWAVVRQARAPVEVRIERVVIVDDADYNVHDIYANMIQRQNINVIPGGDVRRYLARHRSAPVSDVLSHFGSQAVVYVDMERDPLAVTSRLVYANGKERVFRDQAINGEDDLLNQHFVKLFSAMTEARHIEIAPVVDDAYVVQTYLKGMHTYKLKGAKAALPFFDICIASNPHFYFAYLKRAKCLRNLGDYDLAIETLQQLLDLPDLDPFFETTCLSVLASSYSQLKQYDIALAHYEQALDLSRTLNDGLIEARVLNNIGTVHYRLKQFDASRSFYKDAFHLKQGYGEWQGIATLYNAALLAIKNEKYKEATEEMTRVLTLSQRYRDHKHVVSATLALGWIQYLQGNPKDAVPLLISAGELAEKHGFKALKVESRSRLDRVMAASIH